MQCKMADNVNVGVDVDEVPSTQKRQVTKPLDGYESSSPHRNEAIYLPYRSGGYNMKEIADYFGLLWIALFVAEQDYKKF
jgi:putative transposase